MLISESWLREWVNPPINSQTLADQLTMAGLEVDGIHPATVDFSGVVVGEVESIEKHPNADKLNICQVNIGEDEALQIVCGAKNVANNMRVAVATVGAILPENFKIKKSKLRGELSQGMICSASELGLADSSDGIMSLPVDAPIGENIRQYFALDDTCIDIDLTPDRGDCLSIAGVAREIGVLNELSVNKPDNKIIAADIDHQIPIEITAKQACPRYCSRVIEGINVHVTSPIWLQEKLRRSGIRSLGVVVDVTNYVLLELGQPMHAFDLDKIAEKIEVRFARDQEKIHLLNGDEVECTSDTLVIADKDKALALAGIMGGSETAVSDQTTDILLESAFFNPLAITGKARHYGLHTDSSHRFERGVDPKLQEKAIERATALIIGICGGRAAEINTVVSENDLPVRQNINLRRAQINRVLGVEIADDRVEEILERLEMSLNPTPDGWQVTAPSFRFDIEIEVDLIEELGRIYGYERIPTATPVSVDLMQHKKETAFDLYRAKLLLADLGYQEAITYTFISPEMAKLFSLGDQSIALANPISRDMSVMRTNLIAGLVQAMQHNKARQQDRVWLFETGLNFIANADSEDLIQKQRLAGLITGTTNEEQWSQANNKVDFYDMKGHLEAIFQLTGKPDAYSFVAKSYPILHPGQSAAILCDQQEIGFIGLLHPEIERKLQLPAGTYVFEISIEKLQDGRLPAFQTLSKYPEIRRDLALTANSDTTYNEIHACIKAHSPEILQDIILFDVYTGEHIDADKKSVALSLIMQDKAETLTDEKIDAAIQHILQHLSNQLSVTLRD